MLAEIPPEAKWFTVSDSCGVFSGSSSVSNSKEYFGSHIRSSFTSIRDYYRPLVRCTTVNPAETLPTLKEGEPHDCIEEAERYSRLKSDLQALTLKETDLEYWTDGSCYGIGEKLSAGYVVVKAQGSDFVIEKAAVIPQPASA